MEKLISDEVGHESVPESYILPSDSRPVEPVARSVPIPVIDFGNDHQEIVNQVLQAGKEFGIFQVVNHGIPQKVIEDMLGIVGEFFELPSEDKAPYYSDDARKPVRLGTGKVFEKDATLYWRDYLKLVVHPVEEWMHLWPEKPTNFREIVARYTQEVRGLSMSLLRVICEGLGLEDDYLSGDLSSGCLMQVNHYPACPDPSLTLGLPKHIDTGLMTLLLQGNVSGLQALYGGEWIEVEPLPYAFVVNFGYQLEFITNGIIKGVEHRAATNSTTSRTTVASFVIPELDCFISPASSMIDELTPRLYRSFPFKEFLGAYLSSLGNKQATLEPFRIKN